MRIFFFCSLLLALLLLGHSPAWADSPWKLCASAYMEAAYLNEANTAAGLLVPKLGICDASVGLELYGTARTGVDSRTFLDKSDAIYNDNYLFLGAGLDYTKLLPGVRLSLQIGNSFDLNSKIHRGGLDVRAGWMTYHEIRWKPSAFRNEIYSEGFYVRRYQNFIASIQIRNFYTVWNSEADPYKGFELGPYVNLMASRDTVDYDYNRFLEAQYGARIRYQGPVTLGFHILGIKGYRTDLQDPISFYTDFRLLLTGYWEY